MISIQVLFFCVNFLLGRVSCNLEMKNVVFVHSYSQDYKFTNLEEGGALRGLQYSEYFGEVNLRVHRYFLNAKGKTPDEISQMSDFIYEQIVSDHQEIGSPHCFIVFDDPAFEYFGLRKLTSEHLVVFGGVNRPLKYYVENYGERIRYLEEVGEYRGTNLTGVYEDIFFIDSLRLLMAIRTNNDEAVLPKGGAVSVIIHDTVSGSAVYQQVLEEIDTDAKKFESLSVDVVFENVVTFEDLKRSVYKANMADEINVLYPVFNAMFSTKENRKIPEEDIHKWIIDHSEKPEISVSHVATMFGFLGGLSVDIFSMGETVGLLAGGIMSSGGFQSDNNIGAVYDKPKRCMHFNVDRARDLQINLTEFKQYADFIYHSPYSQQLFVDYTIAGAIVTVLIVLLFIVGSILVASLIIGWRMFKKNVLYERKDMEKKQHEAELPERAKRSFSEKVFKKLRIPKDEIEEIPDGGIGSPKDTIGIVKSIYKEQMVVYKKYMDPMEFYDLFEEELTALYICKFFKSPDIVTVLGHVMEKREKEEEEEEAVKRRRSSSSRGFLKRPPPGCVVKEMGIIIEFCHRGNLLDWIEQMKAKKIKIGMDVKLRIAFEIARGMELLHSLGIIHLDIKPQNILLTKDMKVKITDFDFSTIDADMEKMKEKINMGTVCFKSPEMILGKPYVWKKTDVYSYGILLMMLLTESLDPFEMFELSETERRQVAVEGMLNIFDMKVARGDLRPTVSEELKRKFPRWVSLMTKCWEKEQLRRPSFEIIKIELDDIIKTAPEMIEEVISSSNDEDESSSSLGGNGFDSPVDYNTSSNEIYSSSSVSDFDEEVSSQSESESEGSSTDVEQSSDVSENAAEE